MINVARDMPFDPESLPYDPGLAANEAAITGTIFAALFLLAWAAYMLLWVWMLIHCLRNDPDRYLWFLLMFLFPFPATPIYFFVRWLPNNQFQPPQALRRWTRGGEIRRLELAAMQIGNPHQYIQLGDALRDVGRYEQAGEAYAQALKKDARSPQALWGAALVAMHRGDYTAARDRLGTVLEIDPQYKFGDVSLEYGKTLDELGEREAAREHLQQHVRRWRHPEALYRLALILADEGRFDEARQQLQAMLLDINSSPRSIARKFGPWKSRAQKLLRRLPRNTSAV